jgi:hypothetical protein
MTTTIILAATALLIAMLVCAAGLSAWRGWLELRRLEIAAHNGHRPGEEEDVGLRIELAAVRERLKKLEAIASGVEL